MIDTTANPVFLLVSRGSRWPTPRGLFWLRAASAVAGMCFMPATVVFLGASSLVLIALATIMIPGAYLLAGLFLAALLAARYAAPEQLALIRISGLAGLTLAQGLNEGIRHRLRALDALGLWLIIGTAFGAGFELTGGGALIGPVVSPVRLGTGFEFVWAGLLAAAGTGLVFYLLSWAMTNLGAWIGLRWPRHAAAAAGAAIVIGAVSAAGLAAGSVALISTLGAVPCIVIPMVAIALLIQLETWSHQAMARLIDGRADPSPPSPGGDMPAR